TPLTTHAEELEKMARRRCQHPTVKRRGKWWIIQVRQDELVEGRLVRKNKWLRIAPSTMGAREAQKVADEYVRPMNQSLEAFGSATNFGKYVDNTYIPIVMPLLASSTQDRYAGIMKNYLKRAFGKLCLRDVTALTVQRYFSSLATSKLSHESRDKIRDVLSSILGSAVQYGLLASNPVENTRPPSGAPRPQNKQAVSLQGTIR